MSVDPWTDAAIKELQSRGLSHFVWMGGFVIIGWTAVTIAITWFLGQRLTLSKLRQAGVETRLKSGDVLDRIENSRIELSSQNESFSLLLRDFSDALRPKRKKALKAIREEICRLHSKDFVDRLRRYVEDCKTYLTKSDARDRMLIDVLPALRTSLRFAEVVNHEKILKMLNGASPYRFDRTSMTVFLRRIRKSLPIFAVKARWQLFRVKWKFRPHYRK
jgi:hypothetical protein